MDPTPAILANTILPAWIVIPAAAVTMLVLAGHVRALQEMEMPIRRRRIRTVNGVLMIFVTSLLAYAIAIVDSGPAIYATHEAARQFVLIWLTIISILGFIVALAGMDAMATMRDSVEQRRTLRENLREGLLAAHAQRRAPDADS